MNEALLIIFGAMLAIGGGWISDEIRAYRERGRELKSIKVALSDELEEIETTIKNMHEVWNTAKVLSPKYLTALLQNTTAFNSLRTRLFLIKDSNLRKNIVKFYKKLQDTAKEYEGKLGSLAETPEATAEQTTVDTEFQKISTEIKDIKEKLA